MRRGVLSFLAWAFTLGMVAAHADAQLRVATDHNPPLAYADSGVFAGLAVELLNRAASEASVSVDYVEMPWPRAFSTFAHAPGECLIGLGRTPEREAQFLWVGPFAHGGIGLFALASRPLMLRNADDVIGQHLVVGVAKDDVAQAFIKRIDGVQISDVAVQTNAPRMLEKGRFDLWATGAILGRFRAAAQGVAVREVLRLRNVDVSLGCAPGTDPAVLAKLQSALDRLHASGTATRLEHAYLDTPDIARNGR